MSRQATMKPVLLSKEQVVELKLIQEEEQQKSPLGIAPSIHAIARGLIDKDLKQTQSVSQSSIQRSL